MVDLHLMIRDIPELPEPTNHSRHPTILGHTNRPKS
jgi:hypothetical protein